MKSLLEGTFRFELPYDAYQHQVRVSLAMLGGRVKRYDLHGDYRDEDGVTQTRIFIECKNVEDAAGQGAEFVEFLARAYSATKKVISDVGNDPRYEFMWATTCPWKGTGFRQVASRDALSAAVATHIGGDIIPAGHEPDADLITEIAKRIWVWVVSDRQEDMSIGPMMRGWIAQKLEVGE
jgi:hypothetical protein